MESSSSSPPRKRLRRRYWTQEEDDEEDEENKQEMVLSSRSAALQMKDIPDTLIESAIFSFLEHSDATHLAQAARRFAKMIRTESVCRHIFRAHYTPGRRTTFEDANIAVEVLKVSLPPLPPLHAREETSWQCTLREFVLLLREHYRRLTTQVEMYDYLLAVLQADDPIVLDHYLRKQLTTELRRLGPVNARCLYKCLYYCNVLGKAMLSTYSQIRLNTDTDIKGYDDSVERLTDFMTSFAANLLQHCLDVPLSAVEYNSSQIGLTLYTSAHTVPHIPSSLMLHYKLYEQLRTKLMEYCQVDQELGYPSVRQLDAHLVAILLKLQQQSAKGRIEMPPGANERLAELQQRVSDHGGPFGGGDRPLLLPPPSPPRSQPSSRSTTTMTSSPRPDTKYDPKTIRFVLKFLVISLADDNEKQLVILARRFKQHLLHTYHRRRSSDDARSSSSHDDDGSCVIL